MKALGVVALGSRMGRGARTETAVETDPKLLAELARMVPGQALVAEPMARHTSFGLGGPADLFIEPTDPSTFRECTDYLIEAGIPVTLLGRGTNVLVRSGGIDGAVMTGARAFTELIRTDAGVRAGGGVSLPRLLSFCAENGLSGLEGLSGIPGSVGGAVVTNAGSFGVSIGDSLTGVTVSEPGGTASFIPRDEMRIAYRRIGLPSETLIEGVELALDPGDPADIRAAQQETFERKWKTQPSGMRCAGCVFMNPAGGAAGRLIDEAGLKCLRVGGAVVSDLHANFIVNDRGATSEDVEELIEVVRERVADSAGVTLELEIEIVGRR